MAELPPPTRMQSYYIQKLGNGIRAASVATWSNPLRATQTQVRDNLYQHRVVIEYERINKFDKSDTLPTVLIFSSDLFSSNIDGARSYIFEKKTAPLNVFCIERPFRK